MLARLAENLFWAGRYIERAEDTARMVDVTYHSLLESPIGEATRSWNQLLDVLHLKDVYVDSGGQPSDSTDIVRFLTLDPSNDGSISTAVVRARENVRSVRELVSSELWEAINELHLELRSRDLRREVAEQPSQLLRHVRNSCMAIYGVASETMPRDTGWRFLALGRLLERAEMTCRLIDVRYAQLESLALRTLGASEGAPVEDALAGVDFHHWIAVLKSASGFEAYRRRYRASTDPVDVVEFLLLDEDMPRSVLYALNASMAQLEALSEGRPSRALRLLGRATASLKYRDVGELLSEDLHTFLEDVQLRIHEVAEAVADEFFRHQPPGSIRSVARA